MNLPEEATKHYQDSEEQNRLASPAGRIEFLRTRSILEPRMPPPPARILDLGGGTGPYAFHFAALGYSVDLVDAMPLHIEQACSDARASSLKNITVGDARNLNYDDGSFDVVLLMGPLYHLTELEDRQRAMNEVYRVLRPGGLVFAAAISKFASLLDGYFHGLIDDPVFQRIVSQDLVDGQHRNPDNHPSYFTTTKFHAAEELREELISSGFSDVSLFAIEGFAWLLPNLSEHFSGEPHTLLMRYLEQTEQTPEMIGMSAHILGVGMKPV